MCHSARTLSTLAIFISNTPGSHQNINVIPLIDKQGSPFPFPPHGLAIVPPSGVTGPLLARGRREASAGIGRVKNSISKLITSRRALTGGSVAPAGGRWGGRNISTSLRARCPRCPWEGWAPERLLLSNCNLTV